MNNKGIFVLPVLLVIVLSGCSNKIILQRLDTEKPVVVRMNAKQKVITVIEFPFNIVIENLTLSKKEFGKIDYEYNNTKRGVGILLYRDDLEIRNNQLQTVQSHKSLNYFAYTGHFTEFTEFTQAQLQPYLEKMIKLKQDTLHVGSVAEFKVNHPELFKMLTEKDTISIRFYERKSKHFSNRQAIPASW